jgi:sulfur carrier protein ThiS
MPCEFVLTGSCARALLAQTPATRRRTLELLAQLERHPARPPDFQELGPSGRTYAVVVEQDIIVTYWLDDAVREVRIVQIEWL